MATIYNRVESNLYGSFRIDHANGVILSGKSSTVNVLDPAVSPTTVPNSFEGFPFVPVPPATPEVVDTGASWPPSWLNDWGGHAVELEAFEVPLDPWGRPIEPEPDVPTMVLDPKRKIRLED